MFFVRFFSVGFNFVLYLFMSTIMSWKETTIVFTFYSLSISFIFSQTIHCPCVTLDNQFLFALVKIKHYYQDESEMSSFLHLSIRSLFGHIPHYTTRNNCTARLWSVIWMFIMGWLTWNKLLEWWHLTLFSIIFHPVFFIMHLWAHNERLT